MKRDVFGMQKCVVVFKNISDATFELAGVAHACCTSGHPIVGPHCGYCGPRPPAKIARMTFTTKLDRNLNSALQAHSAPPRSVTDTAIAPFRKDVWVFCFGLCHVRAGPERGLCILEKHSLEIRAQGALTSYGSWSGACVWAQRLFKN